MKRALLVALLVMATAVSVHAQEMDIVRVGGQVDQFNLADIDSITFGAHVLDMNAALREGLLDVGDILRIHALGSVYQFQVTDIDSVSFTGDELMTIYRPAEGPAQFNLADIDSMTFASTSANAVEVTYSGTTATVINPLAGYGVSAAISGADVTVTSTAGLRNIDYVLSGTSSNGMFKIYSDRRFNLHLSGVTLTNSDGPAINNQADDEVSVELVNGTTNSLTDGATYATPPAGEDQKAAFFSEGQLVFTGTGSLTIHGLGTSQNGLCSDDYVDVESGTVVVSSAVKDGIHTNEGYYQRGGTVQVTSTSDGIDAGDGPVEVSDGSLTVVNSVADKAAVKSGSGLSVSGGVLDLTVQGNQSKGLKATDIALTGGTVTIHTSGGVVLVPSGSGYDPSYCAGVKADDQVLLDGCQLTITATGTAGRGVSSDGTVVIQSGALSVTSSGGGGSYTNEEGQTDAYHGPCVNADGDITLSGGAVTLSHSGSGGRGITTDTNVSIGTTLSSPTLHVTTTGAAIPLAGEDSFEAKAIKADSLVTVNNGNITIGATDDAIKSEVRTDVYGGLITISNSYEGLESPNIYIHGGEMHVTSTNDCLNGTYGGGGEANDGSMVNISGGYVHLSAPAGDGIDSNGNLTIGGGTVLVHGPGSAPEVGVDVNGTFLVNGSFMVISQFNSNMIEVPSNSSTQRTVLFKTTTSISAGTLFHVETSGGTSVLTFKPARTYSSILFSSSSLAAGTSYKVYTGGTCTGTLQDGLYTGGTYSGGTLKTTFTSTSMVQTVNF
jgi:trimeric autotransporter adhesin